MAVLTRALVIIGAYLVSCLAAVVVIWLRILAATAMDPATHASTNQIRTILVIGGVMYVVVVVTAFLPAVIAAALAEFFRLQSVAYYAVSGGLVGAVAILGFRFRFSYRVWAGGDWLFVLAGVAAGLVYWAIAVRGVRSSSHAALG